MPTILIVEDDNFLRELLSKKISSESFDVLEAETGEIGVKIIDESPPDLVLLDLMLPGMDGFEVLRRAKSNSKTAKIPIIILSNLGNEKDIDRGYKLGADGYLIKSNFSPAEIINKINEMLSR